MGTFLAVGACVSCRRLILLQTRDNAAVASESFSRIMHEVRALTREHVILFKHKLAQNTFDQPYIYNVVPILLQE